MMTLTSKQAFLKSSECYCIFYSCNIRIVLKLTKKKFFLKIYRNFKLIETGSGFISFRIFFGKISVPRRVIAGVGTRPGPCPGKFSVPFFQSQIVESRISASQKSGSRSRILQILNSSPGPSPEFYLENRSLFLSQISGTGIAGNLSWIPTPEW